MDHLHREKAQHLDGHRPTKNKNELHSAQLASTEFSRILVICNITEENEFLGRKRRVKISSKRPWIRVEHTPPVYHHETQK